MQLNGTVFGAAEALLEMVKDEMDSTFELTKTQHIEITDRKDTSKR